jgi:hypothetical protein
MLVSSSSIGEGWSNVQRIHKMRLEMGALGDKIDHLRSEEYNARMCVLLRQAETADTTGAESETYKQLDTHNQAYAECCAVRITQLCAKRDQYKSEAKKLSGQST